MGYLQPNLTNAGLEMLMNALMDGPGLTFTKIVIGNGPAPASDREATSVRSPVMTLPLTDIEEHTNFIVLSTFFDNSELSTGFYINELGVYAQATGSEEEVLYAYRHTSSQADYIPANDSGRIVEVTMRVIVSVGQVDNISAVLIDSEIYASKESLNDHIHDYNNPHRVTKAQVGLGNVDNLAFLDNPIDFNLHQSLSGLVIGETIRVSLGKIAMTIATLISHLQTSNPHNITKSTVGLSNVVNAAPSDYEITFTKAGTLTNLVSGSKLSVLFGQLAKGVEMLLNHLNASASVIPHSLQSMGIGYGTCSTSAGTATKAVTLAGYNQATHGIVAVKFTYAVQANATLNINSQGAKSIYYKGTSLTAGVILAGDTATFIYDGTRYHLLAVDHSIELATVAETKTYLGIS